MSAVLKTVFICLVLTYPLLVYFGLSHFDLRLLALFLILLAIARVAGLAFQTGRAPLKGQMVLAAILMAALAFFAFLFESPDLLRFYPVTVNILLLILFSLSLIRPPSIVERLALLSDPELPAAGIRYTWNVTLVWCVFFLLNGAAALFTAIESSMEVWAFYNGFLSYLLMGILFAGEFALRHWVKRRQAVPR
jgi:uncharacterized membrane protein